MITREKEPANLEMPFHELDGPITPTEQFYVRSHFPVPSLPPERWRLRLEGATSEAVEFRLDELRDFPARSIQATVECAGNNRIFLSPKAKGVQWELGAVGNAEWTGVPLSSILERAGVPSDARHVILEGADSGSISEPPRPADVINYARSIPLEKARVDVLLAYSMNGQPLTAAHGSPLRAIVPGWYGMASVKWLTRIILSAQPFRGYYETVDYAFWKAGARGLELTPLSEMQVKAQISNPQSGEILSTNDTYIVRGAAWSGSAPVSQVELSTNAGETWEVAALSGEPIPNAWRLWEYRWTTPAQPGRMTLIARATDMDGNTQLPARDHNRGTYMINHWLPIEVELCNR